MTPIANPQTKSAATSKSQMKILVLASNSFGTGTTPKSFRRELMKLSLGLDNSGQNAFDDAWRDQKAHGSGQTAHRAHDGTSDNANAQTHQ